MILLAEIRIVQLVKKTFPNCTETHETSRKMEQLYNTFLKLNKARITVGNFLHVN